MPSFVPGRRRFVARSLVALPSLTAFARTLRAESAAFQKPTHKASTQSPAQPAPEVHLNVREFGARGDGTTLDTAALQNILDRCAALGGGEVLVPAGEYLTGGLQLRSNTTLRLEQGAILRGTADFADYPVSQVRWEGKWVPGHIALLYAIDAQQIRIIGPGKIIGNPALGGRPTPTSPLRHPALMEFIRCDALHLEGFSTEYTRMWSIHLTSSRNITISKLTIRSTGGNGDGIDVDSSRHVSISDCDIATGDDCISLKSGRGAEAYAMAQPTEDVDISNCTFADSIFACIGIGSETSGGIRNVRIRDCKFTAAKTYAIYMKTRVGRGAFIENVEATNLDVSGCDGGFLRFNITGSGLQDQNPVPGDEGIPTIRNWRFSHIVVHDVPRLVEGTAIHPRKPLQGFALTDVSGTCREGIFLANIRGAVLRNIDVTGFKGPLLNTFHVTGSGLAGANALPAPETPPDIPAAAQPYVLR